MSVFENTCIFIHPISILEFNNPKLDLFSCWYVLHKHIYSSVYPCTNVPVNGCLQRWRSKVSARSHSTSKYINLTLTLILTEIYLVFQTFTYFKKHLLKTILINSDIKQDRQDI